MSGEAAILCRSWRVGSLTCTLTVPRLEAGKSRQACIEWEPHSPSRLTAEEWAQYRTGRNEALAALAIELGITVAVVEV